MLNRTGRVVFCLALVLPTLVTAQTSEEDWRFERLAEGSTTDLLLGLGSVEALFIGESPHFTTEIPQAIIQYILPDAHRMGFGTYAFEVGHAQGWMIDQYTRGEIDTLPPGVFTPDLFRSLRAMNSALDVPMRVAGVDLNHCPWAFSLAVSHIASRSQVPNDVTSAIASQFGNAPAPLIPEPGASISEVRSAWNAWLREGYPFRDSYEASLANAIDSLAGTASPLASDLRRLMDVELESARLRYSPRDAARERVMVQLTEEAIAAGAGRAVIHVGLSHSEKLHSLLSGSILAGGRLGQQIHSNYRSFHIFAYGLSGARRENAWSERDIEFDHTIVWPTDNMMTRLGGFGLEPGYVALGSEYAQRRQDFGIHVLRPADHWDAILVFPEVTVHPYIAN